MKKLNSSLFICILLVFQSCLFGVGLVERNLTGDYWLFANGKMDEMSIWYSPENGRENVVVDETVFAIGFDDNFIIAKSHPKDSVNLIDKKTTYYHIVPISKSIDYIHKNLTKKQFESIGKVIGVPENLDFTIIYSELE